MANIYDKILKDGKAHTVKAVFDGGVCAVYFVTDGRFCDGGENRQFGFTRFDRELRFVHGLETPKINKLLNFRFWRTAKCICEYVTIQ